MKSFFSFLLLSLVFAQSPDDPRQALIEAYSKKKSLLDELEKLDQQATHIQKELFEIKTSKTDLVDTKTEIQIKLKNIAVQYQEREGNILTSMDMLYKLHRRGLARIIFGAENPVSLRRRSTYLRHVIGTDQEKLKSFRTLAQTQKILLKELEASEKRLQTLEGTLKQKERSLRNQKEEKQKMLEVIQSERNLAKKLLGEVNQSRQKLSQQISPPQQISPQSSSTGKQNFSDQYGQLPWPVQGTLLHRFGKKMNPITKETVKSLGIDIQLAEGAPVQVVADGVVTFSRFIEGYGNTVIVRHGSHSTVYAHLSAISVRQAEPVSAGQIIGKVGSTGLTDTKNTPWLTFEVRYKKQPQDPLNWLKR